MIIIIIIFIDIALTLDSLLIQLQDKVTQKWYQFGIALGIEKDILDRCLNYPPEQSIVEILDRWLRRDAEQSWGEIAKALRLISYHKLAEEIESIDETGINYTLMNKKFIYNDELLTYSILCL